MTEYYINHRILSRIEEDLEMVSSELAEIIDTYVDNIQDMMNLVIKKLNARPDLHDQYMKEAEHYIAMFQNNLRSLYELDGIYSQDDVTTVIKLFDPDRKVRGKPVGKMRKYKISTR